MSQLLEIHNLLTLSTGHLEQRWFLRDLPGASMTRYGMLLWVPDDIDESLLGCPAGAPDHDPTIVAVRRFAREHGCDWILFDADGPMVQGLQFWNW